MKVLISCDDYCYKLGDDYYLRDFGMTLVNRYLMSFDKIRFVVRTKNVNSSSNLGNYNIRVSDPRVEIWPIDFFQGPKQFLKLYFQIAKRLKNVTEGCDCAIFRLPSTTAFWVCKIARKHALPYATELVFDCKDAYQLEKNIFVKYIWWNMHRQQVVACKNAIGIAPVTKEYLQKRYVPFEKNIIISHYSSIELNKYFYFQPRHYPEGKQVLEIVHVAQPIQFNGRKGHNDMMYVLKILKDKGVIVNVTFIGGDRFNSISKLIALAEKLKISSQVMFTGFLSYTQLRERLISADLAILPTKAEGLPRVLIEAMATGLPCLASNVSGNPELLDSDFLFEYGDRISIASKIENLVNDHELYESASRINFERSQEYCKDVLDVRRRKFYEDIKKVILANE